MNQHICPWWLGYTIDNPLRSLVHKPEKIFSGLVSPNARVADIGCGMGHFSMGLARMVGRGGKVYAVDLQPRMLDRVVKRARKAGLSDRIETRLSAPDQLNLDMPLDFAVAFYMVHETPDVLNFFKQVRTLLKAGGALLLTEPRFHVRNGHFEKELTDACNAGFKVIKRPCIAFSHAALLNSAH